MAKRIDLTGQKFGEWTVLEYVGGDSSSTLWKCRCSCGTEKNVTAYSLRSGKSTSCGCKTKKAFQDLTGKQFGEWKVLEYAGESMWKCQCSCGKIKEVHRYQLTSGKSKSCGHNTTGFKDLTGKQIGELTVLKYLGNYTWECKCSCGKIIQANSQGLSNGRTKSCGHTYRNAFKDLTGQKFGEWEALEYTDGKWKCRCSCGKEQLIDSYSLTSGHTKSCGHNTNTFQDLTGQQFGEWTILSYAGEQKFNCRCSCGKEQLVSSWLLKSGQSTSCGHSKIDFNDIIGTNFGPWKVLEYLGNYKYKCQCTCGATREISRGNLNQMKQTTCVHNYIDCEALIGKQFGEWIVLEYLGKQRLKCKCSCGTERIISESSLRTGHTKSCGCKKATNFTDTMISKYGEVATNKITNPRDEWQREIISNKENFNSFIIQLSLRLGRKPKIGEIAKVININNANTGKLITKYGLNELIEYGTFSESEEELYRLVTDMCNDTKVVQRDRAVLNGKELDIYIPDKKIAIEFNGDYWHSSISKGVKYHQNKTIECNNNGIRLIHLFEYEWENFELQYKLIEFLESIINFQGTTYYARDCIVGQINKEIASKFLEDYHLQGNANAEYYFGLVHKDNQSKVLGVMSFGKPRFNKEYQYELIRFCWRPDVKVIGGAEKIFKHFISKINPQSIITYSDASKFTGKVYERLGFKYLGMTDPNYKWVNDEYDVKSRYQTMKHKLIEQGLGNEEETEDEIMENLGYYKVYDCGNYKYEYRT